MSDNWQISKEKKKGVKKETEYAILVGVISRMQKESQVIEYLDELEFLAETAGAKTIKRYMQKLDHPDKRTYVGKGKLEEIKEYIELHDEVNMLSAPGDDLGHCAGHGPQRLQ